MKVNRFALVDFMDTEGLRLTDLAEKSGVSISFLSELRSGTKTEASAAVVKKLADVLGVRPRSIASSSDADSEEDDSSELRPIARSTPKQAKVAGPPAPSKTVSKKPAAKAGK